MVGKDLDCWSAMIFGDFESDSPQKALELFNEMQLWGIKPDQITMLSVISACAHLGALDQAKWIHKFVERNGFGEALRVNNVLMDIKYNILAEHKHYGYMVDLYGHAELLREALKLIEPRPLARNVVTWGYLMAACRMHALPKLESGKMLEKELDEK
ncbi:Pentatricopeptide repeat [Dillenia turbinata]|uniref:Pentatricopeptide repeat n=1 Tax=Dillenia turbinata TaxID=194707 RepID=A0AAN8VAR5_9MAGN